MCVTAITHSLFKKTFFPNLCAATENLFANANKDISNGIDFSAF